MSSKTWMLDIYSLNKEKKFIKDTNLKQPEVDDDYKLPPVNKNIIESENKTE